MFKAKAVLLSVALASAAWAVRADAQTCSSNAGSCTVGVTASVAVPALISLDAGSTTLTLTPPDVADLATGYVQDAGPTFVVKANRTWTLAVHTSAAANWTYVGTQSGVKAIGDLTWSETVGGTYVAITGSAAPIVTSQARTNAGAPTIFFRTLYSSDFSADNNAAGSYSIPLVFTLSAP